MTDVDDDADERQSASAPSAPSALSLGLAAQRQKLVDQQRLTLPVPRWTDPALVVTYRPLDHDEAVRVGRRAEKIKDQAARDLASAADQLVLACVAIEAVVDGQRYSLRPGDPDGPPTRFDDDLAANLGTEGQGARATCQALFLTSPDLLAQARQLVEWSGYKEQETDEAFLGE